MDLLALMYVLVASEAIEHEIDITNMQDTAYFTRKPPQVPQTKVKRNWCIQDESDIAKCGYESRYACKLIRWGSFNVSCATKENLKY